MKTGFASIEYADVDAAYAESRARPAVVANAAVAAAAATYLASPEAAFVTGAGLNIDGGFAA